MSRQALTFGSLWVTCFSPGESGDQGVRDSRRKSASPSQIRRGEAQAGPSGCCLGPEMLCVPSSGRVRVGCSSRTSQRPRPLGLAFVCRASGADRCLPILYSFPRSCYLVGPRAQSPCATDLLYSRVTKEGARWWEVLRDLSDGWCPVGSSGLHVAHLYPVPTVCPAEDSFSRETGGQ